MFKFLTPGAKIIKISSSIITIATLAVLAAVITALALSSFTAEAQGDPGAVANLQLTSTTAGTLTVSWDAASPVPTDYRIDWAKSGEDYKSWKVDEGHKYPDPSATTATIADLDHDTEYQIRMRARYYKGEHMANPGAAPGKKPQSRSPENRRRHPPLNLHPIPHLQREPSTPLPPPTMTPANSYSPGQLPRLQTPRPRITT